MLQATLRTITELLDSKKAAYSFVAVIFASVLHLYFGVTPEVSLLLVSPLGLATAAQAHVDAAVAKSGSSGSSSTTTPALAVPIVPATPADDGPKTTP